MKTPDSLNQVASFHRTFNHPILEEPAIPSESRCKLRVTLIQEELKELEAAIQAKDLTEIADALCDIQYVLSGAVLEFGLGEKFYDLFQEVQRSNMSKACDTLKQAEETIQYYKENQNIDCYYKEIDGKFLIYRSSDHKTIKSRFYSPVNLKKFIEATSLETTQ